MSEYDSSDKRDQLRDPFAAANPATDDTDEALRSEQADEAPRGGTDALTAARAALGIGNEGTSVETVEAEPLGFHLASWKMTPSVCRWPERSRLTPWRMLTR